MKKNPVGWFEIYVKDMPRARKFYEAVFQGKLEKLESPVEIWAFPMDMKAPGTAGGLVKMDGFEPGGNGVLVYFSCKDCAVEEGRVVKAGGTVQKSKTNIGMWGFISIVFDTEGNMIGLHSSR